MRDLGKYWGLGPCFYVVDVEDDCFNRAFIIVNCVLICLFCELLSDFLSSIVQ